jgi:hypothetical protein
MDSPQEEEEWYNEYREEPDCIAYLRSLDEKHKKAFIIAKDHLKTSFDLKKSNGFLRWIKNKG